MKKICSVAVCLVLLMVCTFSVCAFKCESFSMDCPNGFVQMTKSDGTVMFKSDETLSNIAISVKKNKAKSAYVSVPEHRAKSVAEEYTKQFVESVNSAMASQSASIEAEVSDYGERTLGDTKGFYIEIRGKYVFGQKGEEPFTDKIYLFSNKDNVISIAALSKSESDEAAFDKALSSFKMSGEALIYKEASPTLIIAVGLVVALLAAVLVASARAKKKSKAIIDSADLNQKKPQQND